ncbi:hypothetical protein AB1Y20_010697 [Prymnesium parvum]|uniref:Uncharacterized protein n=1 Tax=Prymnesium parvum TaxID=97485 RepID=A0AB34IRH7_PRYPA
MPFALKAPCGRGDATRQPHCDWRFCPLHAEAEKLFLLTSVEPHASAASLRRFLSHYSQLGLRLATNAQVVLHADARRHTDWLDTLALLAEFGVRKPAAVSSPLSPSSRRSLTNAFLRQLPPDAALLAVGLEELVHFRCGARGLATRASVCGLLANREGSAPPAARGGYGLCERTQLRVGAEFKYVLIPARLHGGAVREGRNLTRVTRHGLVYAASDPLGRMDTQPLPCEWAALVLTPARVVYTSLRPAGNPGVREQGLLHSLRRVGLDAPLRLKTFGFRESDKSDAITADAAGSLSRMRFCQALLKNSSGQPFLDSEAFLPAPLEATGIELQPLQPRLGLDPVVLLANCTPAMPECCVFPSYRGSSTKKYPCAHSDAYDQGDWVNGLRVVSWSWSIRSCSAQVGHTLSFLEAAAPVKRVNGTPYVRVSRDGSLTAARYEELQTLHSIVQGVTPGVVTMGGSGGPLAGTVKLLASGRAATITVSESAAPTTCPLFTVRDSVSGALIRESTEFVSLLELLSVSEVSWEQFTQADGWGLPPLVVAPTKSPLQWPQRDDSLSVTTEFGLPPVSSNIEVLQFLLGCCDAPPQTATVEELSLGFAADAPDELREAMSALVLQLSAATPNRPEVVDSAVSLRLALRLGSATPDRRHAASNVCESHIRRARRADSEHDAAEVSRAARGSTGSSVDVVSWCSSHTTGGRRGERRVVLIYWNPTPSSDADELYARAGTALGWLRRFTEVVPSRKLFVPHRGAGDVHAAAYNEETFRLFAEFIRRHGSVRAGARGEVVSSAAIADYISAIRAFRSREAGYNLLVSGGNLRLPPQLKHMRREDGPTGARELQRALSARLLRRLCQLPAFDRRSFRGVLRWAVLWGGHNLLLRGGEFGRVDHKEFVPAYGLTLADCDWIAPCAETSGYEALVVEMMVIKDERVTRARIPCLIRRRQPPVVARGADPCCAYDALRALWDLRVTQVPAIERASAPLFANLDGAAINTQHVLAFVREAAAAVGEPAADFDSRSLRIGGATDLYHLFGPQEAERLIAARGRWCSMIHQIYTRLSATSMLAVSSVMADATGVDLEAFRHGYVMPAVVRARRS